jgi:hypothetical protein
MARPIKGDIRVIKVKQKRSNGDVYVYERQVKYNPKTRLNKVLSSKLIGKITLIVIMKLSQLNSEYHPQIKNIPKILLSVLIWECYQYSIG